MGARRRRSSAMAISRRAVPGLRPTDTACLQKGLAELLFRFLSTPAVF